MIQISIMLFLYLFFLTAVNILANPIPAGSNIETSSADILDNTIFLSNSDTSDHAGCSEDTSSISDSDGNLQDGNIFRRGPICPVDSLILNKPVLPGSGQSPVIQTAPSTQQLDPPSRVKYSVNPCGDPGRKNPERKRFVSCSTPEVWHSGILERVLNCVDGKSRPHQH